MTQSSSITTVGSDNTAAETPGPNESSDSQVDSTTNSSLLLRLFTSQFFDCWLAVSYLFRYPNIIGVQHYLCNELRKFPLEEIEFFLPQLVHLLATRPNESTALESMLLDMCLQSSHVSISLYWYLQAYLADQSANPRTISFKHCQRIFNQVQALLFTDIAPELVIDSSESVQHAYLHAMNNIKSAIPAPRQSGGLVARFKRMFRLVPQIRENSHAALVGISSTFVSLGSPSLAPTMGWIAIAEGKGLKLSETAAYEPDISLQHRSLAVRSYNKSTPSLSRSRSAVRNRAGNSLKPRSRYKLESEPTHSAPETEYQAPLSARDDMNHLNKSSDGYQSHTTTPLQHGYEDTPPFSAYSASPRGTDRFEQLSADAISHSRRLVVGSRSPTPAERLSTESCHTVAVMESSNPGKAKSASTDFPRGIVNTNARGRKDANGDIAGIDRDDDIQSRKTYLTKATKQFQRNAKTFDRRLGRSSDSNNLRMRSGSCILPRNIYGDASGGTEADDNNQYTHILTDLESMSVYMEKERRKLERRSGYFGAEIRFMTALMDISRRVCAVAKAGRQQFLKAELTLLNHSLDKNTCIPLWCPEAGGQHHHRIVRIPTEDTVVLNSAERAPYLLTLEVLEPDESTSPEDHCAGLPASDPVSIDRDSGSEKADTRTSIPTQHQANVAQAAAARVEDSSISVGTSNEACVSEADSTQSISTASIGDAQSTAPTTPSPPSEDDADEPPHTAEHVSSPVVEDVDEKLMAEVFGDIDNISNVPEPPLSPATIRRHSGSYGRRTHTAGSSSQKKSIIAENHSTSVATNAGNSSSTASASKSKRQTKSSSGQSDRQHPISNPNTQKPLPPPPGKSGAALSRIPVSQDEIRARMRTASVLLAQLARQQKALGIKVNKLFIPQTPEPAQGDGPKAKSDASETLRRRNKLSNATAQALAMEEIREKLIHEMMQLEEIRLKQPGLDSLSGSSAAQASDSGSNGVDNEMDMHQVEFKDDPSAKVLKEDWESKKARIRRTSPYGRYKNWNLLSVIVKEGSDLRQEQLALQLIREMQRIWQKEQTNVFVQYYRIVVTGEGCGLMETITNTVSVHSIKKEFYSRNPGYAGPPYTLYNYFVTTYGTPDTERFRVAQDCFVRSLVSYSLITYVLQIRDRHNGNILLDTEGHIIHIDFGFMLSNSPGSVGFEQAPFKFPMEYVDILGGRDSAKFAEFRSLLVSAFLSLRKHAENICLLVEMMLKGSPLPCLSGGVATVNALRDRFHPALAEKQIEELVDNMLISSCDNMTTRMYDAFQYYSNGIL